MLIANATVKKMGLQGLYIEDFERQTDGADCWDVFEVGEKRVGPKISSVNILIINQGCYTTPREPLRGCMVTPESPWSDRFP